MTGESIDGVQLRPRGVDSDGEELEPLAVTLALHEGGGGEAVPDLEITTPDGSSWAVPLADVEMALAFEKSRWSARKGERDGD